MPGAFFSHRASNLLFVQSAAGTRQHVASGGSAIAQAEIPASHVLSRATIGTPVGSTLDPGMDLSRVIAGLEGIPERSIGSCIYYDDVVTSTQTVLQHLMDRWQVPVGTVVLASQQTQGTGRSGNVWESPLGCLMFSFSYAIPLKSPDLLVPFQYVIALGVYRGIKRCFSEMSMPLTNEIQLKWPNDIYMQGKKVGGVVCRSAVDSVRQEFVVSTGIGLDVDVRSDIFASLVTLSPNLRSDHLFSCILWELEVTMTTFRLNGWEAIRAEYEAAWMHSGAEVTVMNIDGKEMTVEIIGISGAGELLGRQKTAPFEEVTLHPDGNRFDLLKGLIVSKPPPTR